MVEINFLCVHKKLRLKRMAPVLIKEITRRVNLEGIFQAVYTAGVVLPGIVSKCRYVFYLSYPFLFLINKSIYINRYWHRSLNVKKLLAVKFSHLGRNMTVPRMQKLYRLPEVTILIFINKILEYLSIID
jgi:glycylpeptide N-tetradecanoyltransferase